MRHKDLMIHARDHRLMTGPRTLVMGILNVTPDSFSGDGIWAAEKTVPRAVRQALSMISQGADILDIGGESTRPGAGRVSSKEECRRIVPVIRALSQKTPIPLSVDTCKPEVAEAALDAGASIVNVVQGTAVPPRILKMVLRYRAAIVLMHMRGDPRTMQGKARYRDVLGEISLEIEKSVEKCLETGIKKESIIVDPGICFAKTVEHNLLIIQGLRRLCRLGFPVLIGPSRKSFIGKVLDLPVEKRMIPTASAVALCIMNGARIVRVHDVRAMKQAAGIADAVRNVKEGI